MELSTSTSESNINTRAENWFVGDQVFAPFPGDEKLYEATIKSISTDEDGKTVAIVRFSNFGEETVAVSTLKRKSKSEFRKGLIFDDDDLEKPFFHDKKAPGPKVSFKLSDGSMYVPCTINRYLRDYQRDGVQFISGHYFRGGGCILGDDMGLGKTVQVISFLAAVLHKTGTREDIENNMPKFVLKTMKKESKAINDKIFLIIAPLSLLYNWKDELDTWGYFRVCILHGNQKDRTLSCIRRRKCEIALTTYETVRLCLDDINCIEWSAVFVDEAHKIKNPKAQITQSLKALKCRVRIGLTGTILQNNMDELWCVMDWAVPGCLGNRARFKEEFCNPIEFGQRHTATKRELAVGRKSMRRLAKCMSFWFLRRTKALISDQLPKKDDRVIYCSLTEFQKTVYKAVLETEDIKLVLHGWNPCDCNSGRKRKNCCYQQNQDGSTVRQIYFSYLAILRKVSNHVALLQPDENTSKMQASTVGRVCEQVFCKFPDFVQQSKEASFTTISDPKYSGKMKVLQRLLDHCRRNQDKILLFSLSTKLLDVLERYCMAAGLDYRRLDGKTKTEERVKIVKEFNSTRDINICLVSTMAGGLGLNFVGANIVVIFDPTWNPANDLQAIDRVYRIGQCRDVKVFRLISLGTIEEIMYLRQLYKQQLHCAVVGSENAKRYFNAVQGSKEHYGELFGVQNLFGLRTGGSCLTRDIIQRTGQVEAGVTTAATQLREEPPTTRLETTLNTGKILGEENIDLLMQPDKGSRTSKRKAEQFSDFSSDSETEPSNVTKMKSGKRGPVDTGNNADSRGQLNLAQCGFSKLLERKTGTGKEFSESDWSSDDEMFENPCTGKCTSDDLGSSAAKTNHRSSNLISDAQPVKGNQVLVQQAGQKQCQNWSTSSESEGEAELRNKCKYKVAVAMGTDNSAEESDDVIHPSQMLGQKKKVPAKKKSKHNFLSKDSEDSKNENFTNTSGDVQEVAFIHSNQHVIGSSKAENQMSHTAIRDVFELKQYSQIPANVAVHTSQKLQETVDAFGFSLKSAQQHQTNETQKLPPLSLLHPVAQTEVKVHRAGGITFLIGQTPKAICRKQLSEMAEYFNMASVEDLAEHVLSSTPQHRLTMLREFYTSRYPELRGIMPAGPPEPPLEDGATVESSRVCIATDHSESREKKQISSLSQGLSGGRTKHFRTEHLKDDVTCFETQNNVISEKRDDKSRLPHIKINKMWGKSFSTHFAEGVDSSINVDFSSSPTTVLSKSKPNRREPSSRAAVKRQQHHEDRGPPEEGSKCNSDKNQESIQSKTSSITELLGDTSILDALFERKKNHTAQPVKTSGHIPKGKCKPKDFWDFLNQSDNEYVSTPTDLSVIERLCLKSKKKGEKSDDTLWKKNDKFLWKKGEPKNDSGASTSGTFLAS
ncbi:DNA excision repair protein ERCC-6-like 2 isoform X4 [Scyliorhinus torazame]|uniref:DNA excision repair protein ERCC-6-like 2 isoform X4 n=1 Tax=Scyliorhinus torazame TaxID=75743 RepID=UPI003B58EC08